MASQVATQYIREKSKYFIRQIINLKASDFSHDDAKLALDALEGIFRRDIERLDRLPATADEAVRSKVCTEINIKILTFLPILGFILRSSNVRNSFELFDPLLRLCRQILGADAKLVLSSEWNYSPHTYPLVFPELPKFVFIGSPAFESGNALITPLAGHELGHSVWRHQKLREKFDADIQDLTLSIFEEKWSELARALAVQVPPSSQLTAAEMKSDIFLNRIYSESLKIAFAQAEEVFCDVFAVRIFGPSFLLAFEYLLAPGFPNSRALHYPPILKRAEFMEKAAARMDVAFDMPKRSFLFDDERQRSGVPAVQVSVADTVVERSLDELIDTAKSIADDVGIPKPIQENEASVLRCFKTGVPIDSHYPLADIINAGWKVFSGGEVADAIESADDKLDFVNELIFKSIEVGEFRLRNEVI